MTHLAIDLGSTNRASAAVLFDPDDPKGRPLRFQTTRAELLAVVAKFDVRVVIIESCRPMHWVRDMLLAEDIEVLVINTNHEDYADSGHRRRKTDPLDARRLMMLFLSHPNFKDMLLVPLSEQARVQRQLLDHRRTLVEERTGLKSTIRHHLDSVGLVFPGGKSGWTQKAVAQLEAWATKSPTTVPAGHWQRLLARYLRYYRTLCEEIAELNKEVTELEEDDQQAQRLRAVPGVGLLTALALSASLDRPERFANSKQVSRYSGFEPVPLESGKTVRNKGISRRSWSTLRGYLYEACYAGIFRSKDPWLVLHYERLMAHHACKRKVICIIARRLYVLCWRMLRNDASWEDVTRDARVAAEKAAEDTADSQASAA